MKVPAKHLLVVLLAKVRTETRFDLDHHSIDQLLVPENCRFLVQAIAVGGLVITTHDEKVTDEPVDQLLVVSHR